jgi:hypothetical protein
LRAVGGGKKLFPKTARFLDKKTYIEFEQSKVKMPTENEVQAKLRNLKQ